MATYDLTSKATAGVNSDSIANLATDVRRGVYVVDKIFDVAKMIAGGYTFAAGDVFQLMEIPADTMVLSAGAIVETVFDGTTPTVDIDFAGGDDIVDGGDVTALGALASGTNGSAFTQSGTINFTQLVSTTDTIDVTLNAGASDVTTGVIRVVAVVADLSAMGDTVPTEVTRDQLA